MWYSLRVREVGIGEGWFDFGLLRLSISAFDESKTRNVYEYLLSG